MRTVTCYRFATSACIKTTHYIQSCAILGKNSFRASASDFSQRCMSLYKQFIDCGEIWRHFVVWRCTEKLKVVGKRRVRQSFIGWLFIDVKPRWSTCGRRHRGSVPRDQPLVMLVRVADLDESRSTPANNQQLISAPVECNSTTKLQPTDFSGMNMPLIYYFPLDPSSQFCNSYRPISSQKHVILHDTYHAAYITCPGRHCPSKNLYQ